MTIPVDEKFTEGTTSHRAHVARLILKDATEERQEELLEELFMMIDLLVEHGRADVLEINRLKENTDVSRARNAVIAIVEQWGRQRSIDINELRFRLKTAKLVR